MPVFDNEKKSPTKSAESSGKHVHTHITHMRCNAMQCKERARRAPRPVYPLYPHARSLRPLPPAHTPRGQFLSSEEREL